MTLDALAYRVADAYQRAHPRATVRELRGVRAGVAAGMVAFLRREADRHAGDIASIVVDARALGDRDPWLDSVLPPGEHVEV